MTRSSFVGSTPVARRPRTTAQPHLPDLKFLGIDTPGAPELLDGAGVHAAPRCRGRRPAARRVRRAARRRLPRRAARLQSRPGDRSRHRRWPDRPPRRAGRGRARRGVDPRRETERVRRALAEEFGLDVIDPTADDVPARIAAERRVARRGRRLRGLRLRQRASDCDQTPRSTAASSWSRSFPDRSPCTSSICSGRSSHVVGARVYEPEDYDARSSCSPRGRCRLDRLVTRSSRSNGCRRSSTAAREPASMKILVDCRA